MSQKAFSSELLPGLEDGYDQIQKIAIGGMAEVYRARQKHLDRAVAIKRIRPELRQNPDIRERFRREAHSSANLLHQNLAHVYDYIDRSQEAYIVMEFIDGFDLAEMIEKVGALPIDIASMIAVKILSGLGHIHAHGMIHRDLKPDNIRISTRGEVKIMDFGIAFDPSESNLTLPGMLMGSPHYLSPEQVIGARLDQRSDIFAFGITFYQMLTGKRPFFETQKETVFSRIQKGQYIEASKVVKEIPPFLEGIIEQCLAVDPNKRPTSAHRIAASLTEYLARHYSLAFEARVRQFLLESKLINGNPALIEVSEATSSGLEVQVWRLRLQRAFYRWGKRFIWGAGIIALGFFIQQGWKSWNMKQSRESEDSPPTKKMKMRSSTRRQ